MAITTAKTPSRARAIANGLVDGLVEDLACPCTAAMLRVKTVKNSYIMRLESYVTF